VITHFTLEQLPIGRPLRVDEPHEPVNADNAAEPLPPELVEPPPDEVDPPELPEPPVPVVPAAPPTLSGAVGTRSFEEFWNPQAVAASVPIRMPIKGNRVMGPLRICIGTHGSRVSFGPPTLNSQEILEVPGGSAE
jgi:hypothetical protein